MRLKRLTIKGFKSFADQTDIHFNEDLIGIVGPNGSGKSNVVDSIRWVLGEQKTKELRLESMSDVLFNGTKARKPGKVAKVTLSFDNTKNILPTEYNEVSISRVLYRNGNSEYLLNNVACRKKDITNLFIDSGIGSNSYAIISLNMVEDILHDNGGSRRAMIEQAAGISKYKVRKKETLNKLRATTEDLDRVQDLLFEIEKNMASFERQAKRTERFNVLKQDYKELSIKISHIAVRELNIKYQELKKTLEQEKDERLKINTSLTNDEALLQQLKTDILKYEKSLSEDQQQFNKLIEDLGKIENNKNLALQRLQSAKDRVEELSKSAAQLNQSIATTQKNVDDAKSVVDELKVNLKTYEDKFDFANLEFLKHSESYDILRQREKEIKSAITANQLAKETVGREVEALTTRKSILETDIKTLAERVALISNDGKADKTSLEALEKEIATLTEASVNAEEAVKEGETDIETANTAITSFSAEGNSKQVDLSSIQQRMKFLQNIIENNEGLPESVKFVLKENEQKFQVLSDLIEIKDVQYTKIVELYLESVIHYIVADTRQDAIKLYEQVRGAQKGKINIAVLDEIKPTSNTAGAADLIPLSEVIKVDAKYQALLEMVCKDTFISKVSYKDSSVNFNSFGGIVLFPNDYLVLSQGKVYGGSNTLFEGVQLGRKKMLEKLEKQAEKLATDLANHKSELDKKKQAAQESQVALRDKRTKLSEARGHLDREKSKLYQIKSKIDNQLGNIDQLEKQSAAKQEELKTVSQTLEVKRVRYEELESVKVDDLSDKELALKIEEAHKLYISFNAAKENAQSALFEERSKYNMAEKDVQFFSNSISSIHERIEQMKAEEATQKELITTTEASLEETKASLETQYTRKKELQSKLSEYEDTYYKEKGRIFELEKQISELRSSLYQKDQSITTQSEQFNNLGFEIKGIHERNSIEFGIEIKETEFPEEYEGLDLETLKTKKNRINDRIRNYGEINPMAITAYNEIKGRHDQISKERNDILDAQASLEETIAEIEKTAAEKFYEALDLIRINFKEVFQSLFSDDDSCDIVLLDNEDPLEAKIEIVAKPKGKRPKSINLLSGGEKTLTAASFLFALYLLKPAPFCIFDEVDAPLDDVNCLKFNKLIKQFSKQSQFITITHNKLTMSEVDILYGVYLKELGVSGVSAVDFRTYDQTEIEVVS